MIVLEALQLIEEIEKAENLVMSVSGRLKTHNIHIQHTTKIHAVLADLYQIKRSILIMDVVVDGGVVNANKD